MRDVSKIMAYLAEHFADWEIVRDHAGWHAYPSARLVFGCYLRGHDVTDLHRETAAGLLVLLEAWKDAIR